MIPMQTEHEQVIWEHYREVEREIFYLRRKLLDEQKENKRLKHLVRVWKSRYERLENKKRKRERR